MLHSQTLAGQRLRRADEPSIAMFLLRCSKIVCATNIFYNRSHSPAGLVAVQANLPHYRQLFFGELQWNAR